MLTLKSPREIDIMKTSGQILAGIHEELRDFIRPGITTLDIDGFVHERIEKADAIASQIGYEGYQHATCTSVNDEICHGIPSDRVLNEGDLVKVDFCVDYQGGISDSCWSYAVGEVSDEVKDLMEVTKEAMYRGIEQAVVGNRIGDIGHAIQSFAESRGYGVVRDFIGHGIGPSIHEEPAVPHYGQAGRGQRLREGMTITIEPMITTGDWNISLDEDGWTARTADGSLCAQYEHSLAITKDGPVITTLQKE